MMDTHNDVLCGTGKLLFDLSATQPTRGTKRHGGGKYGEIVFRRIVERGLPIACIYDSRRWLNPKMIQLVNDNDIEMYDICKQNVQEIVDGHSFELLYSPLPSSSLLSTKDIKIVGTIHGLRRLETPADVFCFRYCNMSWKDFGFYFAKIFAPNTLAKRLCGNYLNNWLRENVRIVTVSNHTAHAVRYFFPELKGKELPVFYSPSTSSSTELQQKYREKFFLMVSGNRCEKNNLRAIMALDRLFSKGYLDGHKAKVTGAKDASNFRYKIKNAERFEFLGYVDDHELEQLYHDAYALIYPSLNEGFGYPPLEAMHYGVPVLASSYSSISEVCQGAAMYFNPFAIEEIANRILQIGNEEARNQYSLLAEQQYRVITERQNRDLDKLIDFLYCCE